MKSFAVLALVGSAVAQSCSDSREGTFNIQITNVTATGKRSLEARQLDGTLTVRLQNGMLTDQAGRTGNIVANHQFQFDSPIQDGSLYKEGFAVCPNGTLTHKGSAIWYQCLSGSFYNLYDESLGKQCNPVYFDAISVGGNSPVSQKPDGQPNAPTGHPVTQISDGQPQGPTGVPAPIISQIPDGQPQAPTHVPAPKPPGPIISQISDGQPQAPTHMPAPKPSGPVVSQIPDGQPQAPRPSGPVVSQIPDGQPQAPRPTGPFVSQISDGQPQAPTAVSPTAPIPSTNVTKPEVSNPASSAPAQFPGAAAPLAAYHGKVLGGAVLGALVGVLAVVL